MGNVPGQEAMAALALMLGAGAGMGMAFALWIAFGVLRRWAGRPTAFFGGLTTALAFSCIFCAFVEWFDSPDGPMVLFGLILATVLLSLMAFFAVIAGLHRERYGMDWGKAFLILMAEVGAGFLSALLLSLFYFEWIAYLLGSYAHARTVFGVFYLTLLLGLPLMEAFQLGRGPRRAKGEEQDGGQERGRRADIER